MPAAQSDYENDDVDDGHWSGVGGVRTFPLWTFRLGNFPSSHGCQYLNIKTLKKLLPDPNTKLKSLTRFTFT